MSIEYPDECFLQSGIPCDCCRVSGREIQKLYDELTEARAEIEALRNGSHVDDLRARETMNLVVQRDGLLRENDELRAENERLKADLEHEKAGHQNAVDNWNEARAEIERLKAAIRWALGEDPDGAPDFAALHTEEWRRRDRGEQKRAFWWRKTLMELAGL